MRTGIGLKSSVTAKVKPEEKAKLLRVADKWETTPSVLIRRLLQDFLDTRSD